jgi:NADPH:quinone reductase-like Zn-dependent oxidoreductase
MKAFVLERYGKGSALRSAEMPMPELRDDEVLVEVHAAGANLLDSKIRDGEFKLILPYRLPVILGHDVAGIVVKTGSRARQFKPGDEVYARPDDFRIGTFAEFVPVREASLALKPKALTMEEAASMPLVGLTAWQALVEKAKLTKEQKVFIQAGSGGVGTFAIQLAKHVGATVATTTSAANLGLVKEPGCGRRHRLQDAGLRGRPARLRRGVEQPGWQDAREISSRAQAWREAHLDLWAPRPGIRQGDTGARIRETGPAAAQRGHQARGRGVDYSFLFMKASGSQLREITRLVEAGAVRPVIDRVFPFESTNEALAYVRAGRAKGKVVVKIK